MTTRIIKLFLSLAFFSVFSAQAATSVKSLQPKDIHSNTLREIVQSLTEGHYNKVELNDSLSSELLDEYLADLDANRAYFTQADINEFENFRTQLDDDLLAGKLDKAYAMFNRLNTRIDANLNWAIAQLESKDSFDFTIDETLNTDRSEAPWMQTELELKDLWRKRLKAALLNMMLSEKTEQEARATLLKRYKNQKKRLLQNKSEDVFQRFANSFTKHFDPHTSYFSPRTTENFKINMSLSLDGIGAVLKSENENTQIVRLVPAGPADKTGQLKASDIIVGVGQGENGEIEDVVGWRLDDVVDKIRGPKGSKVKLEIIPASSKDQIHKIVLIERNTVKLEEQAAQKKIIEVKHQGVDLKVGVIEIPTFYIDFAALQRGEKNYRSTTRDVEKLINELKEEGINGLIIDLRNNGGGSLREANDLVGLFINRGPTVQIQDALGKVNVLGDFDPKIAYTGPMAVLVNRLSASASEIFAGAIQDYRRGLILGDQTFGKGTVQTLQDLEHGQIKLTNAKFYRISGGSTQHKGVVPDISFPSLIDKQEIGESALDGALPWDKVATTRHGLYQEFTSLLPIIKERHAQRINNQPDFNYLDEQIKHWDSIRDDDTLALQKTKLEAQRKERELWQVDSENRRRIAKGEKPIGKLSELEDLLEKDKNGMPISAESAAILEESANILMDFLFLSVQRIASKSES